MSEEKSYIFKIAKHADYLEVRLEGKMTFEENFLVWVDIIKACETHNCYKILGISHLERFDLMHAIGHKDIFPESGVSMDHKIAWVETNESNKEMIDFIEDILVNRGLVNGHHFRSIEDAKEWLLSDDE